jgi:hypothetical protein
MLNKEKLLSIGPILRISGLFEIVILEKVLMKYGFADSLTLVGERF